MKKTFIVSFYITLCLISTSIPAKTQEVVSWIRKLYIPKPDTVSLLFLGDIMQHGQQLISAKTETGYNYLPCFSPIANRLKGADLTIANIETTFGGPPYSGYPLFSSPDVLVSHLKESGFQLLLTANNHINDQGRKGLTRSLNLLDSLGMLHTGLFRSKEERSQRYPLLVVKKGIRIALLAYSYGTNGFSVPTPFLFNYIDTTVISADIKRATLMRPDFIIACMHWGEEYQIDQNDKQQELASFLKRHGVDIVIGSHPHVVQGMEVYYNRYNEIEHFVAYSLGNVISNQPFPHTQLGLLVEVKLIKEGFYKAITSINHEWIVTEHRRIDGVRKFFTLPLYLCTVSSDSVTIQPDGTPLPSLYFITDTLPNKHRFVLKKKPR